MADERIIVALPALYGSDGVLDTDAMAALFSASSEAVDAAFVNGTNGEFLALSRSERATVARLAIAAFGAQRVILHVGAVTTWQVESLVADGLDLGAQRFAVTPPLVFRTDLEALALHFGQIRSLVTRYDLYAYLYPDVFTNSLHPGEARVLETLGYDGLKVSGSAAALVGDYASELGIPVWTGDDSDLSAALAAGAAGVVSGSANVDPWAWAAVNAAHAQGDSQRLRDAQARVAEIVEAVGPSIAHLKLALNMHGWGSARSRLNLPRVSQDDAQRIARIGKGGKLAEPL